MTRKYANPGDSQRIRLLVEQKDANGDWHCVLDSRYVHTNVAPLDAKTAMSNLRMDLLDRLNNPNLSDLPPWPQNIGPHALSVRNTYTTGPLAKGLLFFAANLNQKTWVSNPIPAVKHAKTAFKAIGLGPVLFGITKEGMSSLDMLPSAKGSYPRGLDISKHTLIKQLHLGKNLPPPDKNNLRLLGLDVDFQKVAAENIKEYS